MEAVLKRDIPTATQLMQAHLNATEQSVAKLLREAMPSAKDTKESP
jgi:DNA-binding GntR family transcriptional regulator